MFKKRLMVVKVRRTPPLPLAWLLLMLLAGCAAVGSRPSPLALAKAGDRLAVDYTCRLADGKVAATTLRRVGESEKTAKAAIFRRPRRYRPLVITVPERPAQVAIEYFGSFEEKIAQTLTRRAATLPLETTVSRKLEGAVAKEIPAGERFMTMARQYTLEQRREVPMAMYRRYLKGVPTPGQVLHDDGNFTTIVDQVSERQVVVRYEVHPGARSVSAYGIEHFSAAGDKILVKVEVTKGALVRTGPLVGRIGEVTDQKFVIDYGHPFGFATLSCTVTARRLTPLAPVSGTMTWLNDFDQGLTQADHEGKPLVLVLYADWCPWCHKMFDQVFPDEAIAGLQDRFVWLRINSDRQESFLQRFHQKSFPLILVLDSRGRELRRLAGFRDAAALRRELESVLRDRQAS